MLNVSVKISLESDEDENHVIKKLIFNLDQWCDSGITFIGYAQSQFKHIQEQENQRLYTGQSKLAKLFLFCKLGHGHETVYLVKRTLQDEFAVLRLMENV